LGKISKNLGKEASIFFSDIIEIMLPCYWVHTGTDLGSAGPQAILVLGPQAGVTFLAVCLKSVKVCLSYV